MVSAEQPAGTRPRWMGNRPTGQTVRWTVKTQAECPSSRLRWPSCRFSIACGRWNCKVQELAAVCWLISRGFQRQVPHRQDIAEENGNRNQSRIAGRELQVWGGWNDGEEKETRNIFGDKSGQGDCAGTCGPAEAIARPRRCEAHRPAGEAQAEARGRDAGRRIGLLAACRARQQAGDSTGVEAEPAVWARWRCKDRAEPEPAVRRI